MILATLRHNSSKVKQNYNRCILLFAQNIPFLLYQATISFTLARSVRLVKSYPTLRVQCFVWRFVSILTGPFVFRKVFLVTRPPPPYQMEVIYSS